MFSKFTFKQSTGWIILAIGIALYAIGYFLKFHNAYSIDIIPYINATELQGSVTFNDNASIIGDIFVKIADVLIIGVVVGYLSGIAQWAGVFKREIQDIIYGKEFLKKRNDIDEIWFNVTKQMFKFKFSDIHKELLTAVKDTLPNENSISYYEDYDADISIKWHDKDNSIIEVSETLSFTLVAESDKEFEYRAYTWTTIDSNDPNAGDIIFDPTIKVDGEKVEIEVNQKETSGCVGKEAKVLLKGKKSYNINYSCTKRYNINLDYIIGLKAQFLIRNLTVTLNFPDGIGATFIENGTNRDFETVKNDENCIKKRLKGVIFSKQGYIFALKEKH